MSVEKWKDGISTKNLPTPVSCLLRLNVVKNGERNFEYNELLDLERGLL